MIERLALCTMLSQALVAFTIELDNAWESQMPHRTTRYGGSRRSPYAVSLRQWSNFMRVLGEDGLTVDELARRTRAQPHLDGMRRWGYVTVAPAPDDPRDRPPAREHLVIPTRAGRHAQAVWRPLPEAIEARWRARFGAAQVGELRATLQTIKERLGLDLPEFLTTSHGGYVTEPGEGPLEISVEPLALSALLSQVLHAFALDFEQEASASLCYSANVLRLLDEDGTIAQLSARSGVAIEPIQVAVGILVKRRFIGIASEPDRRGKLVRLMGKGLEARELYLELPGEIEKRWAVRLGAAPVQRLRSLLEALTIASGGERAPLWLGLEAPPGTWRSQVRPPIALPHFPMPRQSGHPDGA